MPKEKPMLFDMHTHSTHSDGLLSVEALVDKAKERGLIGFALTDHDTFAGIKKASEICKQKGIGFLTGIEFSTHNSAVGESHILGFFDNPGYLQLESVVADYVNQRKNRAVLIAECLKKQKMPINIDTLIATDGLPVGRMHIARELVKAGHFKNSHVAMESMLKYGSPCYIPRRETGTVDIIRKIKETGGIAVVAHPLFLKDDRNWDYLVTLLDAGLDGLEYYHPKLSSTLSADIKKYCEERGLFMASGSDYHGEPIDTNLGKYGLLEKNIAEKFANYTRIG